VPPNESAQNGQSLSEARRRRRQRIPNWYRPKSEDPAQLPSPQELERSLEAYELSRHTSNAQIPGTTGVVRALPRRELETPEFSISPLMMQQEAPFVASLPRTLSRFIVWFVGLFFFQMGTVVDKLLRRDSEQRRAERLLRTIQRVGGTLIKVGQQLAQRVDMLPYVYCVELSKLLDRMPSFPFPEAVAAIERATGKKLKEVFARFDPEPIGSASISCVYQAVLRTGEKVAVKVRRPGIGAAFAADLRALRWLIALVEWLSIVRPGNMRHLAIELENSFMEELDLRREAYFQEIFRRNSQDPKLTQHFFFSAPRVFFEYTSQEVIVQDFVAGMWLWELLSAVEQGNPQALARMKELNIDPKIVARRMLWIGMWGNLTNVMFHADPHPANVVVQANNHIIMIDFGACGHVPTKNRHRMMDALRHQRSKNISGMVKASLALLEPLPRIDLDEFEKDLERVYFRGASAMWSKSARWWERTSATMWLNLMRLARRYNLPVKADTVKGLRATLLYDTLALRLDNEMDTRRETQRFYRDYLALHGKQMRKKIRKRVSRGLRLEDYAKLDELAHLGENVVERIKRLVDSPPFSFTYSISKSIYAFITFVKVVSFLGAVLLGVTFAIAAPMRFLGHTLAPDTVLMQVLKSRAFLGVASVALLVGLRRIMFRLNDRDI
jgi:predicted unusual protein kinase regulating ubiquinone biosynthesis (AarF/ABC1/UbiB family)